MATIRFVCWPGTTTAYLTSLGDTTGDSNPSGYPVTQLAGTIHQIEVAGLTGPWYLGAGDIEGLSGGYVERVDLVDADVLIDTTKPDFTSSSTCDHTEVLSAIESIDAKLVGRVVTTQPVVAEGQITSPVIIGDDYLARHNRAFIWSITPVANVPITSATCRFGAKHQSLSDSFLVTGTVVANNDRWDLVFELTHSDTESLRAGTYAWSVEVTDDSDAEITTICGTMELAAKQT
ncbi:hypothetical protein [Novipirellula artificiosorum]|uniref:Uncharacterized protein n=1 Tax=Novipirellula artificiosorum TaxID=2528016 RepID=A0A5C6DPV0_9BACT|nr:hypothetical protein [Novipirellula artificiosorum]TWU38642.1 hypothetical protein Poly41_31190 [Novipirellula artificiosorum]